MVPFYRVELPFSVNANLHNIGGGQINQRNPGCDFDCVWYNTNVSNGKSIAINKYYNFVIG